MIIRSTNEMKNKILIAVLMLVSFCLLASFASALPIEVTNPIPANGAIDVPVDAALDIHSNITSANGSDMMGFMWTNISGVYNQGNWVGAFTNTTINWVIDASDYSTFYEWGVYVNDSWGNDINQSWNFTTEDAPVTPPSSSGVDLVTKGIIGLTMIFVALGGLYFVYAIYFTGKKLKIKDMMEIVYILVFLGIAEVIIAVVLATL
jgi:hypothetical protein